MSNFLQYGDVVLTDSNYNKIVTFVCDYYSTGNITFNIFIGNGTTNDVSNIKICTNAEWSSRITINGAYVTDNWNTTYVLTGPVTTDSATSITLVVINPGSTSLTTIPLFMTHSN